MKNMIKTAVVGAVAAAFVASVAVAQQAQGAGQGRGRGIGPGGPGGPGGFGFGPAVMQSLTDQQRAQIQAIHDEFKDEGRAMDAKLRQQLELELLADTPNTAKIEELKAQILSAQSENLSRHITVRTKIAQQVLTAEQRAKAREQLANAPGERGRRGRGNGRW
jgi:Spy/CpxP family protein refolding chaperone